MANVSAPATAGKMITVSIAPGAILAKADIPLPVYYPDIDLKEPNAILSIGHTDLTGSVGAVYTPDTRDAALGAGTYDIKNARTLLLGDATAVLSLLSITYKAAGNVKRD